MITARQRSWAWFMFLLVVGTWGEWVTSAFALTGSSDTFSCGGCCADSSRDTQGFNAPCWRQQGASALSLSEGNMSDTYDVFTVKSAAAATLQFSLSYNSFHADGSDVRINTVLGLGWTHSYNIFLTEYRMHIFKHGDNGLVRKFVRNPDGSYDSPEGTAEILVKNTDGSFAMTLKNGTRYHFEKLAPAPFLLPSPPYYVTSITDRNGNIIRATYTRESLLDGLTDQYGRQARFTYNTKKKLVTVTDPQGRVTRLQYSPNGNDLVEMTDPEGNTVQYTYGVQHQVIKKKDKSGNIFFYDYNTAGKPVRVRDGKGDVLMTFSNPTNWAIDVSMLLLSNKRRYIPSTTTKTDGRGNQWQYAYNRNGFITRMVAPDGSTTLYTYDPVTLNVATETDANHHTRSYTYDARGNRLTVTDALGHVTTYTYEPVFNQVTRMTDPNGRTTTYEYDARGNRTRETDPLDHSREWEYEPDGNVRTETDKNGNVTRHAYNAFGQRLKSTDALGHMTTMTYDVMGNLLSRTAANGHITTFVYDRLDRLVRTIDPLGDSAETVYDGNGERLQVIDRNHNSTFYTYDLRRRLAQTTDALGQIMTQTYDGNNNRISITDTNRHTMTFTYDVQNRLTQTTDALGNIMRMTYDRVGNKLTETDANGHSTTYLYDELNRPSLKTDAVGCSTHFEYGEPVVCLAIGVCPTLGSKLLTRQTDGNGKVTDFQYDGLDRLIRQIRKEGDIAAGSDSSDAVTAYGYDPNGNRVSMTEPNGNTTTSLYDALDRRLKETNAAGEMTLYGYDMTGLPGCPECTGPSPGSSLLTTQTNPNGNVISFGYDAKDRQRQVQDLVGLVAHYTYDRESNRLSETDGNGNIITYQYDALYRVDKVFDPLGGTTMYGYDPVGNLLTMTDRNSNLTTYAYDAINRRISLTDALGNTTQYVYDGVGNLVSIIDANSHATGYVYDAMNRRIKETYTDGGRRTFTYDCVGNILTRTDQKGQTISYVYNDLYFLLTRDYPVSADDHFTYDLSGRMLTAERGGWLVTFIYDGANRVIRSTQNGQGIDYAYDIPGRTRTITYPGRRVMTEQTDVRNRLASIDDTASLPPIAQYTYDLGNRVTTRTYRNGTVAQYTYNANNWVLALDHTFGATRIAALGHAYDNEGNKRFEAKLHDSGHSEAYQYDDIYRLVDFKVGSLVGATIPVPLTQTMYNLDPVGNWDRVVRDAVPEDRTHNGVNEITSLKINGDPVVLLTHDDNGNMREDAHHIYDYDEENRLIRVTRKLGSLVLGVYQYDSLSRRVVKRANPIGHGIEETRYFYDEARIIEEQDVTRATLATYVYGNYIDEVLTMDRDGQTYYYHQNTLWSVEAVTDNAANIVERYAYDAYGCVTITDGAGMPVPPNPWSGNPSHSAIGNPYMFTGRQLDEEAGLYYYRARYYDCAKGRFLQRDPLGYVDGMNLYEYAQSNPINRLDALGLATEDERCGSGTKGEPENCRKARCYFEVKLEGKKDKKACGDRGAGITGAAVTYAHRSDDPCCASDIERPNKPGGFIKWTTCNGTECELTEMNFAATSPTANPLANADCKASLEESGAHKQSFKAIKSIKAEFSLRTFCTCIATGTRNENSITLREGLKP